jgi:hypothetical protein
MAMHRVGYKSEMVLAAMEGPRTCLLFTGILGPGCLASRLNETDPDLSNKL